MILTRWAIIGLRRLGEPGAVMISTPNVGRIGVALGDRLLCVLPACTLRELYDLRAIECYGRGQIFARWRLTDAGVAIRRRAISGRGVRRGLADEPEFRWADPPAKPAGKRPAISARAGVFGPAPS